MFAYERGTPVLCTNHHASGGNLCHERVRRADLVSKVLAALLEVLPRVEFLLPGGRVLTSPRSHGRERKVLEIAEIAEIAGKRRGGVLNTQHVLHTMD